MTDPVAEEFKFGGNKAFEEKRYEDAIILYTNAIEKDPANFVYYSNRSAAHHELKNYNEAIRDAKMSISIKDNVKAHVRIATALWAQRKLEEANAEYKLALRLDPNNQTVKKSLKTLEGILEARHSSHTGQTSAPGAENVLINGVPLPPLCGGEFTSAPMSDAGLAISLIMFVVNISFSITCALRMGLMLPLWYCLLCVTLLQQGVNLFLRGMVPKKMEDLKNLGHHLSPLLFGLCGAALLLKAPPQIFFASFTFIYDLVDLLNHKAKLTLWAGSLNNILLPFIQSGEQNRYYLLMVAASFEAVLIAPVILTSGALFTLIYTQYIITRYKRDRYMQAAFSNFRQKATKLTSASFMPPIVNEYAQKFFDFLHQMAQQTI